MTETSCASHNFRFWVTITQLLEVYKEGREQQNKIKTKSEKRLWTVQPQGQFPHPQADVQVVLRQLAAVCVLLLSQAVSLKQKFRRRGLSYFTSSTPQRGPGASQ